MSATTHTTANRTTIAPAPTKKTAPRKRAKVTKAPGDAAHLKKLHERMLSLGDAMNKLDDLFTLAAANGVSEEGLYVVLDAVQPKFCRAAQAYIRAVRRSG